MSIEHKMIYPKQDTTKGKTPLSTPKTLFVYGPKGSGKTTLVMNLLLALEKEHDFTDALYVTGNNKDPYLESIEFPVTDSPEDLSNYFLKVKNAKEEGRKYLIVLDDLQGSPDFNIIMGKSEFSHFVLSSRHYHCWVIMTAQSYSNSFSKVVKGNSNLMFFYPPNTKDELKQLINLTNDPKRATKAFNLLKITNLDNLKDNKPRAFLYINFDHPEPKFFLGLDNELVDL